MSQQRNLWIYPYPFVGQDRELVVAAKKKLDFEFSVLPRLAFVKDLEGWRNVSDSRVLCLRQESPMIADHAFVREPENQDALLAALEWVLTDKVDTRASTVTSMLAKFGWREIPNTQVRYENLSKNLKLNDQARVPIFRDMEIDTDGT